MAQTNSNTIGLQALKLALYILAGIVLVAGLVIGISLMLSAERMVGNFLLPLQMMGAEAVGNMLGSMLRGTFINLGVITVIISLVVSALLFAVGRLVGTVGMLEERVRRLEGSERR